jgi:hypothetical protein
VNLSPRIVSAETFTLIHGGAEIDESRSRELLDVVSDWADSAALGGPRVVEVWGPPWQRLLLGCLATAAAAGGPVCVTSCRSPTTWSLI